MSSSDHRCVLPGRNALADQRHFLVHPRHVYKSGRNTYSMCVILFFIHNWQFLSQAMWPQKVTATTFHSMMNANRNSLSQGKIFFNTLKTLCSKLKSNSKNIVKVFWPVGCFWAAIISPVGRIVGRSMLQTLNILQARKDPLKSHPIANHGGAKKGRIFKTDIQSIFCRLFFVRNPSHYVLMKCGTRQFWHFENEFQHFENEFHPFWKAVS